MLDPIWQQNFGVIFTAAVSLAAVVVSIAQVWVAFITKSREIELERLRHQREEQNRAKEQERDWNFRAVEFVAEHQDLLFGEDAARRDRIAKVMLITFPPAVTQALFRRIEATSEPENAAEWEVQTAAASRLLLLRIDGMYVSQEEENAYKILRFFEDGTVVSASVVSSSTPDYDGIAEWLIPGGQHAEGTVPIKATGNSTEFALEGERLRFTVELSAGEIDYDGVVRGDRLHLNIHSHITGHRSTKTFRFVPVTT